MVRLLLVMAMLLIAGTALADQEIWIIECTDSTGVEEYTRVAAEIDPQVWGEWCWWYSVVSDSGPWTLLTSSTRPVYTPATNCRSGNWQSAGSAIYASEESAPWFMVTFDPGGPTSGQGPVGAVCKIIFAD
jgi:hypothetical protein